jgi:photosystem II stability/assembly factor-like uncharacterized protein
MPGRLLAVLLLLTACTSSTRTEIEKVRDRFDSPDAAAAHWSAKRTGTDDIHRSLEAARQQLRAMSRNAISTNAEEEPYGNWKFLGPGNIGGRTRALLIDPADANVMYAAGVSGGVWKTTTAGDAWRPIGDALANIAVNAMAMHPADRNVIYAGTGEGYFREEERGTALPLQGDGIFVTRDGGETWTQLASTTGTDFEYVNDLVISTKDPLRVYAATRTGVWRSRDGGTSWTRVLPTFVKGGCLDLAWRGDQNGDYLFASCGTYEQATVWRARNAETDNPWEAVLTEQYMGRTSLAISPSNPNVIYALAATLEPGERFHGLHAVFRSEANGDAGSWTKPITLNSTHDVLGPHMLTNLTTVDDRICSDRNEAPFTMGWYTNVIAVDPADPQRVWVGGVDLFRSDDGGRTWGQASFWWADERDPAYVHADQHAIVFHPQYDGVTNKTVFFGNDGGIARTFDARAKIVYGHDALCSNGIMPETAFETRNWNYGVTQFYHGAVFPDGRSFIAGAQDNGTLTGNTDTGPNHWYRISGGDGGYVGIDVELPALVYAQAQWGTFRRSVNGGRTFSGFNSGLADSFLFIAPFTPDPNEMQAVWYGGSRVWRSANAGAAVRVSAPMPQNALISAMAVAKGNSNRAVVGTEKGHIARSDAATTSTESTIWTAVQPRTGFVTSLTFDPVDSNVVYATYAGFGGTHVWMSTDAGATWSPRDGIGSGALPDIPVHSLAVDPTRRDRLYLGTDLGVFVSLDGGLSWAVENTGFAAVVTEHVTIGQGIYGPAIYAFTHGRGAWRAELNAPSDTKRRRGVRR